MSGYNYVGATPAGSQDIATKLTVADLLAAASPSTTSANSEINTAVAGKAQKAYVDSLTSTFETALYYQTQDALNVPLASKGQLNGVATLDINGLIPLAQIPPVGAGLVMGPFGPTAGYTGSAGSTPLKIADWAIGPQPLTFEPWVFCVVMIATTMMGLPIVEVGISNGSTTVYADQTIIARGVGRSFWNDTQPVNVGPVPASAGHSGGDPTLYTPSYNTFLSAWLWDQNNEGVSVAGGTFLSGAAYLIRTQE